jgi:DNA-binding response OmpR family regulator
MHENLRGKQNCTCTVSARRLASHLQLRNTREGYDRYVHILVGTDAQWVLDEVLAALSSPENSFTVCSNGRDVPEAIETRTPDVAILDSQFGSMGGMAVTMNLRLDHSDHRIPHIPVLMLLDRGADAQLAKRSGADTWLVKPLNALTLRRTAQSLVAGELESAL